MKNREPKRNSALRQKRNKLLIAITALEAKYDQNYVGSRLEYAQTDVINVLLNYFKALEYHYRDDLRIKDNSVYNKAMRTFKEIGEPIDPKNPYSEYRLKSNRNK